MANQTVIFGLLGGGALMLVAGITGSKVSNVLAGHPNKLSHTSLLNALTSSGPTAAAGAAIANATLTGTGGGLLNRNQQKFANQLAKRTGLDPNVIAAWLLSEEPASSTHAPNGANNWLNIGATDSTWYAGNDPAWKNPTAAANLTAAWLKGAPVPHYGAASAGIRSILSTAGQSPAAQIQALQNSGWASSGYPGLTTVYDEVLAAIKRLPKPAPGHTPITVNSAGGIRL